MSKTVNYEEPPQEEKQKKWSYLGWGLLFLVVWIVALMFILELALHPNDSIIATIVAYALGLLGIGVFAGLVRSKLKVYLTGPIVMLVVFGIGFGLHFINAPVYNPLAPVSERVLTIVDQVDQISESEIGESIPPEIMDNMETIKKFAPGAVLIDLVLAIPMLGLLIIPPLGTLSITWFVQIFSQKPRALLILSGFFALILFLIGMVITPTVHLLIAGVTDLGTNMSIGAFHMIDGLSVLQDFQNANQQDINEAVNSLNLASDWFKKGGQDISVFLWTLGLAPYLGDVADDFDHLFQAGFILFEGAGPFLNGSYQIFQGFDLISAAFNETTITINTQGEPVKRTVDDELFNEGLEYINEGLKHFSNSSYIIDDALDEVKQVNWEEMKDSIQEVPVEGSEGINPILDEMETYIGMFENATGLIDVLISRPTFANETQSDFATLIHFFKGAYNIMKASEIIGDESNFRGTDIYFNRAGEHFNITYNALLSPEIASLINSDTPILNGTLAFLVDMTGLAAELSYFGGDLGPTFTALNSTLSAFAQGYENITNYDSLRADLNVTLAALDPLNTSAYSLDSRIHGIQSNASLQIYGEFSQTANEFAVNFQQFNLTRNVENAYSITNSFYHLFGAMKNLRIVRQEVIAGKDDFDNTDYLAAYNHFLTANNSLKSAIPQMWDASYYMNQTDELMPQLEGSRQAMAIIYFGLIEIQDDVDYITENAMGGDSEIPNKVENILNTLDEVNTQLTNIRAQ